MKTIEVTIRMTVDDDVDLEDISLYDHDVCDGFEILRSAGDNSEVFKLHNAYIKTIKKIEK